MPQGSQHQVVRRPATSAIAERQEGDATVLQFGARRGEVVTHQADVRDADPRDRWPTGFGRGDVRRRILDELYDPVVKPEADDGCLDDDRRREELTHVLLDLGAFHRVRRRQHVESEDPRVPPHGFVDVGYAHGGMGDTREHGGPGYAGWWCAVR